MFTNERSKRRIPVTHDNFSAKKLSLEEIHVWGNPFNVSFLSSRGETHTYFNPNIMIFCTQQT